MQEAFSTLIELYKVYSGNSIFMLLFLVVLLYLWITEKEKATRIMIYLVAVVFAIFFIPIFAYVAMEYFLDYEVYYRMLWLIPMGAIVSYGSVRLISTAKNTKRKIATGCLIMLLIAESGTFVFNKTNFQLAENYYHVPQIVVDIVEVIEMEEYKVSVAFPAELVEYPRQITSNIFMPYGRDILIDRWNNENELYDLIQAEVLSAAEISDQAIRISHCECLVLSNSKAMEGNLEDYGFSKIATMGSYDIYMVTWLKESMWEQGWKE